MCPPLSKHYQPNDMPSLCGYWLYQLQHSPCMHLCFHCLRAAYLGLREALLDWEEEEGDESELELESDSEQEAGPGLAAWGGAGSLAPEELSQQLKCVPTELAPQDAVPLDLGPEEATDWAQELAWRLQVTPTCLHWPSLPSPWQSFPTVPIPPEGHMVLHLGCAWALEPAHIEAWLLSLQMVTMMSQFNNVYLRHLVPRQALQLPGQTWKVLLEPQEMWAITLQFPPKEAELEIWKLSILKPAASGQGAELVPAATTLLEQGLTLLSLLPLDPPEPAQGSSGAGPLPCTQGQETRGSEPRVLGEDLALMAALGLVPVPKPVAPELRDRGPGGPGALAAQDRMPGED
ncbi:testis-expressed protein 19 [Echinops telfairi]|uniref:Testis-expressed protein 19 n=1 Tax=Echinops telfairi TaxID=9371 RepID=A0ABM0IWD5_ECHTE|nr:testis-expressed protein 19 [Echinops telfairi]